MQHAGRDLGREVEGSGGSTPPVQPTARAGDDGTEAAPEAREPGPLRWLTGELRGSWMETRSAKTLLFSVPDWDGHDPGQHVDLKLTSADGYSAQRSYSLASASSPGWVELTVQTVQNGEVSPYLVETMQTGDELQLRGPIGGWFRWHADLSGPVLLIGGGSGIVPLMAMLRRRVESGVTTPFHLVYVTRTPDHVIYSNELATMAQLHPGIVIDRLYTRAGLFDDVRAPGRLTLADLPGPVDASDAVDAVAGTGSNGTHPGASRTRVYVCGPTGFVENAVQLLQERGHAPEMIRTERFGPTGA
jgi:ferredoxin-NADP reductase